MERIRRFKNMEEPETPPQILTPCSSGRRSNGGGLSSPEFEFWNMVRNPYFPQPNLLSADQLFSDGVLLPLHLLHLSDDTPPELDSSFSDHRESSAAETAELSATSSLTSSSKRWRDIFKKKSANVSNGEDCHTAKERENSTVKEKKREKKNGGGGVGNGVSSAELNINIWPFTRSRSAGNGGTRPRSAAANHRKVSSAPCSRSNSAGESKSRKWPSSPSRGGGVHLGRSSPVWHVRRSIKNDANESRRKIPVSSGAGGSKARVLSLNVPMCIGYRNHLSCRSDSNSAGGLAAWSGGGCRSGGGESGEGVRGGNLFNIRGLFTKKVY